MMCYSGCEEFEFQKFRGVQNRKGLNKQKTIDEKKRTEKALAAANKQAKLDKVARKSVKHSKAVATYESMLPTAAMLDAQQKEIDAVLAHATHMEAKAAKKQEEKPTTFAAKSNTFLFEEEENVVFLSEESSSEEEVSDWELL